MNIPLFSFSPEVYLSGFNESIGKIENLMQGGVYRVVILTSLNDSTPNVKLIKLR